MYIHTRYNIAVKQYIIYYDIHIHTYIYIYIYIYTHISTHTRIYRYADKPDEALSIFTQFMAGFGPFGRLTPPEINIIPELIVLRILSNVVYFVGKTCI